MDVIKVNDNVVIFYKEAELYPFSAAAVINGGKAFVLDTLDCIDSGSFMKNYLIENYSIKEFIVANSHWHWDHVGGNSLFKDSTIISHNICRDEMEKNRESLEEKFEVVYPDLTFDRRMEVYLNDLKLELMHTVIHTRDSIVVYMHQYKILLAGDTLESPLPYIDEVEDLPKHIENLKSFKSMDIETIIPSHGSIYGRILIDANIEYLEGLLRDVNEEDFLKRPMEQYVKEGIKLRESYRTVHELNLKAVWDYYGRP